MSDTKGERRGERREREMGEGERGRGTEGQRGWERVRDRGEDAGCRESEREGGGGKERWMGKWEIEDRGRVREGEGEEGRKGRYIM